MFGFLNRLRGPETRSPKIDLGSLYQSCVRVRPRLVLVRAIARDLGVQLVRAGQRRGTLDREPDALGARRRC